MPPTSYAPGHRIGAETVVYTADLRELIRQRSGTYMDYAGLNFQISLTINSDLYDAISDKKAVNLLQFMVEDAQGKTEKTVRTLIQKVKEYEGKKKQSARLQNPTKRMEILIPASRQLREDVSAEIKVLCRQLERVPQEWWSTYVQSKQEYKQYRVKAGLKIAVGGLMLTGTALSIAAAAPTGGASLALGIVGAQRGTVGLYQDLVKLNADAEKVMITLTKDIETLCKSIAAKHGVARLGGREIGRAVTKSITGYDGGLVTVSSCKENLILLKNKQKGLLVRGTRLSRKLEKQRERIKQMHAMLRTDTISEKKKRKMVGMITSAEDKLDHIIDKTVTMNSRWSKSVNELERLEPTLNMLDERNPQSAVVAGKILKTITNVALAGANAGVGYEGAKSAMEMAQVSIILIDDVGVEMLGYIS